MSNVKSFEVVYGPASVMYGSNAFLGVINIISKDPADIIAQNKTFGINAIAGYGSYNTKFADITLAMQTKDHNIGFSLSGRTFWSDEHDLSEYPEHDYQPMSLSNELSDQYHQNLDITDSTDVTNFISTHQTNSNLYYFDTSAYQIILTNTGIQTALDYDNDVLNKVSFSDGTQTFALNFKLKIYNFTLGWYYWQKAEGPGAQYDDTKYLGYAQGQAWQPIHHFMYLKYDKDISDKITFSNFLRFKTHYLNKNNRIVTYGKNYLSGRLSLDDLISGNIPTWDSVYLFYKASQLRNETKFFYKPFSWLNNITGIEARLSSIQGDYYLSFDGNAQETGFALTNIDGGNQFFSKDIGVYSQNSLSLIKNLKLILAVRYDFNRVRTTQGYGSVWNGRVALVYSPKSFIFKIFNSSAFKDATNREKYSTAPGKRELPNPDLQPEMVNNYEFSIAKKFNENNIIEITSYRAYYSNIIQEVRVQRNDGTYTNQNQAVGKAIITGINAFANWNIKDFNFYANYTYTLPYTIDPQNSDGSPVTDSLGNEISKLRISDIASHRANFGFNYNFKKIANINVRANYVGQRITGTNTTVSTNTSTFNPYFLLNSTINFSIPKTGITIEFTCFNILNTKYYEPGLDQAISPLAPMLIQNDRNLYLSIFYNF
jgi:outer membrane receptor protein involved in Fe transport